MRATLSVVLTLSVLTPALHSQGGLFPWFKRGDPKIETEIFVHDPSLTLRDRSITVFAFDNASESLPAPPDFGRFVQQALLRLPSVRKVEYRAVGPWGGLEKDPKGFTLFERVRLASRMGAARGGDLVAYGTVRRVFRKASGGLLVKVELQLVSTRDEKLVWFGRKRTDWLRSFPVEDCLLHVAGSFTEHWQ